MTTIAYDKNGQIIELYGLNVSGGDVTISQVRAEIAKNVGKGVQLGFDGTLENNIITFTPPVGTDTYQIKENYDYEIDLSFAVGGEVDDDTQMQISNDGLTFYFWTVKDTPATWGDLKDIYTYSNDVGYRWIFKARYHVTSEGNNVFYIYPSVTNAVNNIQLYFDGTHIYNKQGGTQLEYTDVYNIISNKYNLVTVNYADSNVLYPVFWTGDAVEFSNILQIDGKSYSVRLIINAQNQIDYTELELALSSDIPSLDGYAKTADLLEKSTEQWQFELADGSTITRRIVVSGT